MSRASALAWIVAALVVSSPGRASPPAVKAAKAAPAAVKTAPPGGKEVTLGKPAASGPVEKTDTSFPLGPLPAGAKVGWAHAPFQDGDCSLCHERKDAKNPGGIIMPVNELCLSCHEEFASVLQRSHLHKPAKKSCTNCHNAHNSPEKKLLYADLTKLCASCHEDSLKEMATLKVRHLAIERDQKCLNCHNPHSANYERLLVKAPFDLCVSCHAEDGVKDAAGKPLTNIGALLKENTTHHKPVADKDCPACHMPHASANFRLLVDPYPAEFYSSFDPAKYKLCFECHKSDVVTSKETTTLTRFRDGKRNLHFVHVNVAEGRGRTCRACHEVHAAKHTRLIRDAVPFGPRGWLLKTNFHPLPNGGSCEKTCHAAKTYVNRQPGEKEPVVSSLKEPVKKEEVAKPAAKASSSAPAPGSNK